MDGQTVLITLKNGEQITVQKELLISNSPVFKHLFDDLNFDEHVIDDFSPESVKHLLTVLENESLGDLDDGMFRELHKLGTAFKIDWLQKTCRHWLKNKMESASSKDDKIYLFEECWYITDKLKDEDVMNDLVSVLAHKKNSSLLSHYLSDMSKVKEAQIDVLLKLAGRDVELFLNVILMNLHGQKTLDHKLKHILEGPPQGWLTAFSCNKYRVVRANAVLCKNAVLDLSTAFSCKNAVSDLSTAFSCNKRSVGPQHYSFARKRCVGS